MRHAYLKHPSELRFSALEILFALVKKVPFPWISLTHYDYSP